MVHIPNNPNTVGFDRALILVVDDEPIVRESIVDILHISGFSVLQAPDGKEALSILEHQTPDLIISDIMMPKMNGYQFYLRVHQNPAWLHIPFIFLTAKGQTEDIRYAKEMGIDDYLTKPIEVSDLVAAIRGKLLRFSRLKAAENREVNHHRPSGRYQADSLLIDLDSMQVMVEGQEVKLSSTEFAILQRLIQAGGAAVNYEDLLGYDEDQPLGDKDAAQLLRYHIRNLRRKLEDVGVSSDLITNIRSVGYRLTVDVLRL